MDSTELLKAFREEMVDEAQPYMWSDALIYRYLNEAQELFCRKTFGIAATETLVTVPGTDWYDLSKSVLKIRWATRASTGRPLRLLNAEKAPQEGVLFDGRPGPLNALVQGLANSKLRAWPMPAEAETVELAVFRLPAEAIEGGGQDLEIDVQHHLSLLLWVKHRAYGKEDAEAFDRRKAGEYEERFLRYCTEVKNEQSRATRSAGSVMYGGI